MTTEQLDRLFMQRCLELAQLSSGYNAPNPKVGALLQYKNRIIGEGYHQCYGQGHAEVNAFASVKKEDRHLLSKATIYVSLEPCFHYGKTPPCVDLILKHKIPRVVISCLDPFEKVAGRSIERLRKAGVEVLIGVLEKEGRELAKRFFCTVQKKRPYIILKYAQSQDGFIGREGEEIPISNAICKRLVHKWRSEEAAIMVGTNTALSDNPQLNNRHYFGKAPLRVVLDKNLRLPPSDLYLFDQQQGTLVYNTLKTIEYDHLQYQQVPFDQGLIPHILEDLQQRKIQSLFVEGGRQLLQSFIDAGLWDEIRVLEGNTQLSNGIPAPTLKGHQLERIEKLGDNNCRYYRKAE